MTAAEYYGQKFDKNVINFLIIIQKNRLLLERLKVSDRQGFIRITREYGLFVSLPQLREILLAMKQMQQEQQESDELTDDQLEKVAGGVGSVDMTGLAQVAGDVFDIVSSFV